MCKSLILVSACEYVRVWIQKPKNWNGIPKKKFVRFLSQFANSSKKVDIWKVERHFCLAALLKRKALFNILVWLRRVQFGRPRPKQAKTNFKHSPGLHWWWPVPCDCQQWFDVHSTKPLAKCPTPGLHQQWECSMWNQGRMPLERNKFENENPQKRPKTMLPWRVLAYHLVPRKYA